VVAEDESRGSVELPGPLLLAHELRSHLAAVSLASSHLARRLTDVVDDPHVAQSLKIIDDATRRAMELTAWVLTATSQPPPRPAARPATRRPQHVDVVQVVRDVVDDLGVLVPSRKVRITAIDNVAGRGDDVRIRAVLTNVVLTAARRTANGGAIDVRVERIAGDAHVIVWTPDWRPSQEELDDLLRPFANLESTISLDAHHHPSVVDAEPDAAATNVAAESNGSGPGVLVRLHLGPAADGPHMPRQTLPSNNESRYQTP